MSQAVVYTDFLRSNAEVALGPRGSKSASRQFRGRIYRRAPRARKATLAEGADSTHGGHLGRAWPACQVLGAFAL